MTRPVLFDRSAIDAHRARRRREAAFLHDIARSEIDERLAEINRTFAAPAIIAGWPDAWRDAVPGAKVVGDADPLRLDPGAHDLVVHAMALHLSEDPVGQVIQCRRALVPDGAFVAVFPGGRTLEELRDVMTEAEIAAAGGLSPRVVPMTDIRDSGALLQRAGLALPVADSLRIDTAYADLTALARDLRFMGEANPMAGRRGKFGETGLFRVAARMYSERHPAAEAGRIRATFELIFLTGWAPDPNQPKPLRPGSATARLADALNTFNPPDNEEQ